MFVVAIIGYEWHLQRSGRLRSDAAMVLFEYTVMLFGLCNAPGTFQHYKNDTFGGFLDEFVVVYLDNAMDGPRYFRRMLHSMYEVGYTIQ